MSDARGSVDATKTIRDLFDMSDAVRKAAVHALKDAVSATKDSARATNLFQDQTGALRGSIVSEVDQPGMRGRVSAGAKHARFVENGTTSHPIEARAGGTLRFVVNGTPVFRKRVQHPGTRPRPFMGAAAAVGEQTLDYGMDVYVNEAIEKV